MKKISVLFIGLGGIGAPIASQLISHPNINLSYLCKSKKIEKGSRTITIKNNGETQVFDIKKASSHRSFDVPKDIIILSCKAHQNQLIYQEVVNFSDENTLLLVLQNGVGIDKELEQHNFPGVIFNCVVVSCSHKISTDTILIEQLPKFFLPIEYCRHRKQRLLLQSIFSKSDISYHFTQETLKDLMWKKFAFVICISAATFKFSGPCSMILNNKDCLRLFEELCHEFSQFAKLMGVDINANSLIDDGIFRAKKMPVTNYSSMTLDALDYKYGELAFFINKMILSAMGELPNFEVIANMLPHN
ncbi:ketopantoate reductase family protein [Serratia ureilytica]|uniref:ketopantoate reductase family protein n=1 Tax=Serratia ureilytica TaxID=300181 RepID=UPI0018D95D91|nr:2-dehydropantoate 2-reductase N-terminal domain-containing protein [Serratia ureilytica]MBH2760542.1 ketopantoate reductase [Serratia ureilytica]